MDARLSAGIMNVLRSRERDSPVRTTEIINSVGRQFTKRDVNRELYSLQRRGKVVKVREVPPMWRLAERGSRGTSPFDLRERARPRGMSTRKSVPRGRGVLRWNRIPEYQQPQLLATGFPTDSSGVESRLLEVLTRSRDPLTAGEIGQRCQLQSQNSILSALSSMQRNGVVKKISRGNSCAWALSTAMDNEGKVRGESEDTFAGCDMTPPQPAPSVSVSIHSTNLAVVKEEAMPLPPDRIRESILVALSQVPKSVTALEIAKSLGFQTRKNVNPTLYKMAEEGSVEMMAGEGPPKWRLLPSTGLGSQPVVQELLFQDTPHVASDSGSPQESMETDSRGYEDDDEMEEQDSPFQVDLSSYSETDVAGRVMAVFHAYPDKLLTSLDLAQASKSGKTRSEMDTILRQLESEGTVGRTTGRFPVLWGLRNNSELAQRSSSMLPLVVQLPQQQAELSVAPLLTTAGSTNPMIQQTHLGTSSEASDNLTQAVADLNRNPVSVLSEYCQLNKQELSFPTLREFGPPHRRHFVIGAVFGDLVFESESTNKKEAKRAVAELALQHLRAHQMIGSTRMTNPASHHIPTPDLLGTSFHDQVAKLSHDMHAVLENKSSIPLPGRKVIATFVMENLECNSKTVVSFGSGTRCITGDQMSLRGDVVNDSHAEVVARRGLLRFLYQQLLAYHGHAEKGEFGTIFTMTADNGLVSVKNSVRFHLYISTAPCGDGAQFSREEQENREPPEDGQHCPTILNKSQGLLRTKMEGGEGTIPMGDAQPQTWDGILQGGRLRTMSCSDKVGRWNVLGLQGALLSLFMHPVYMSSLTLGSLHHHGHLSRAVCCRFSDLDSTLPEHFRVNHPLLGRIQGGDEMKRHVEKTSNHCMNWVVGDHMPEVTVGPVGRPVSQAHVSPPPHSQVCKAELYSQFLSLCKITNRTDLLSTSTYQEAKLKAVGFQEAKSLLYKFCKTKGYGLWMKKPFEQEMFGPGVIEQLNIH